MKNSTLAVVLAVVALGIIGAMAYGMSEDTQRAVRSSDSGREITLHKSPTCGCCGEYGTYLEDIGYTVHTEKHVDMAAIKERYDVPYELESCHTMEVEGYVVEGHVPNEAIEKLLAERPDIRGIGMAGMPSGSPGMPGPKAEFHVFVINHDGTKGELFMQL